MRRVTFQATMLLAGLSGALTGCGVTSPLASPFASSMTPDQLREIVKDKNAGVTCVAGTYAGARVVVVTANADKGVPTNMEIGDDCKVKLGPAPK